MSGTVFLILTLFLSMFSGILLMYGITTPSIANTLTAPIACDIANSPAQTCSFPAWRPPNLGNVTTSSSSNTLPWYLCWTFLPSCFSGAVTVITNTGSAIWNGLQLVAYAMAWFAIASFVFFNKAFQGILLIYGVTQVMNQGFGIPFITFFWLGLIIFNILYGVSMLKPGGSGLPG